MLRSDDRRLDGFDGVGGRSDRTAIGRYDRGNSRWSDERNEEDDWSKPLAPNDRVEQ